MSKAKLRFGLAASILLLLGLLMLGGTVLLGVSFAVSPEMIDSGAVQLTPPCQAALAGQPCITCGMTRSFCAMSRGQLGRAFDYNALGPWAYGGTWVSVSGIGTLCVYVVRTELIPAARQWMSER